MGDEDCLGKGGYCKMLIANTIAIVRFLRRMDPSARLVYLQMHLQLAAYWVWCKLTRKQFAYSPYDLEFGPRPSRLIVVKAIPGVAVTVFGRTIWLITPMALQYKRSEDTECGKTLGTTEPPSEDTGQQSAFPPSD